MLSFPPIPTKFLQYIPTLTINPAGTKDPPWNIYQMQTKVQECFPLHNCLARCVIPKQSSDFETIQPEIFIENAIRVCECEKWLCQERARAQNFSWTHNKTLLRQSPVKITGAGSVTLQHSSIQISSQQGAVYLFLYIFYVIQIINLSWSKKHEKECILKTSQFIYNILNSQLRILTLVQNYFSM